MARSLPFKLLVSALIFGACYWLAMAGGPEGPEPAPTPQFTDVTAASGIKFQHINGDPREKTYIFETKGGGVAAFDYDNDGWMDVIFAQGSTLERWKNKDNPGPALYHNNGDGTFTDVTAKAGIKARGWGMGAGIADYDNDGFADIYLTFLGSDVLYHNNGDGTFTDVTAKAGFRQTGWKTSAAFGDYDGDGNLDLYISGYLDVGPDKLPPPPLDPASKHSCQYAGRFVMCGPRGLAGERDWLFHNNGDGTFTDVTEKTGAVDKNKYYGLGVVWGDMDNDGDLDIYVANDATPNLLFVNLGNGKFDEHGMQSGLAVSIDGNEQASMGVDVADYDNDGLLDAYCTHFAKDYSTLYHNEGKLLFVDVTRQAQIEVPDMLWVSWGTRFADFNHDGWKDIFHANGHVYPFLADGGFGETWGQRPSLYMNRGNGTFKDAASEAGPDFLKPLVSRGVAFADFDNDGDIDILIANMNGSPVLLRNDRRDQNHWAMFRTVGRPSNRDGIGARITVTTGKLEQIWEIKRTVGIYSASDPRAHFGLGAAQKVDLVTIRWPSGKVQEFRDVPADAHYVIDEQKGLDKELFRPAPRR